MKTWLLLLLTTVAFNISSAQQLEAFQDSGKYGIKESATGKIIVAAKYDEIYSYTEGLAMVSFEGKYGFMDAGGNKIEASQKFEAELTLRAGKIVWDLNGLSAQPFKK